MCVSVLLNPKTAIFKVLATSKKSRTYREFWYKFRGGGLKKVTSRVFQKFSGVEVVFIEHCFRS